MAINYASSKPSSCLPLFLSSLFLSPSLLGFSVRPWPRPVPFSLISACIVCFGDVRGYCGCCCVVCRCARSALCCEDYNRPEVKMSPKPVTSNLMLYANNLISDPKDPRYRYQVNLFDTVGLGDGETDVPTILQQIMDEMPRQMSSLHKVVFCFKIDRLRAKMAEELVTVYNFFKLVGAKPENFVMILTFCDVFNKETIEGFWATLGEMTSMPMINEIQNVTYTTFPNFAEMDTDEGLLVYLRKKQRTSKLRVFEHVIKTPSPVFFPNETIIKMPLDDFSDLLIVLLQFRRTKQTGWQKFFGVQPDDQQAIMKRLFELRGPGTRTPQEQAAQEKAVLKAIQAASH